MIMLAIDTLVIVTCFVKGYDYSYMRDRLIVDVDGGRGLINVDGGRKLGQG